MTRTNLIPNPSFKTDMAGWQNGLRQSGGFTNWNSAGTTKTNKIPATAGLDYTASAYFQKSTNTFTRSAASSLHFFDSGGTELDAPSVTLTPLATVGVEERRSDIRTAPGGTTHVEVWLHASTSGLQADNVLLEEGSVLGSYFDGDTVRIGYAYDWTGLTSTETPLASGSRINMVTNPSFGINGNGYLTAISRSGATGTANVSGAVGYGTATTAETVKAAATAGLPYAASAWLHRSAGARDGAVSVHFFDAAGTELDAPTVTLVAIPTQLTPTLYSSVRTAPAGTTQVSLRISASGGISFDALMLEHSSTVDAYFDGDSTAPAGYYTYWTGTPHGSYSTVTTTPPPVRTNLFTHPSAEGTGITWTAAISDPVVTLTSDAALFGSESYKMTVVTGAANQEIVTPTGTSGFPVIPGQFYTASAYSGRSGATSVRSFTVKINWYHATTGALISSSSSVSTSEGSGTSLVWVRQSSTGPAPTSAGYASVQLRWITSLTAGEVHYVDGVMLEHSPWVDEYFDGSTSKDGYADAWTGTPHASPSTRTGSIDAAGTTVSVKHYESAAWAAHTAVPKYWDGSAWVVKRPKRWDGASWIDLA